ncbi:hypothetical protein EG329_000425 [Mollisiaceae sp. DMI_Dod_QoI]|nr:hypothetical protein EG329_000425 [Helotiales sp. DMI_Dod_QoI]
MRAAFVGDWYKITHIVMANFIEQGQTCSALRKAILGSRPLCASTPVPMTNLRTVFGVLFQEFICRKLCNVWKRKLGHFFVEVDQIEQYIRHRSTERKVARGLLKARGPASRILNTLWRSNFRAPEHYCGELYLKIIQRITQRWHRELDRLLLYEVLILFPLIEKAFSEVTDDPDPILYAFDMMEPILQRLCLDRGQSDWYYCPPWQLNWSEWYGAWHEFELEEFNRGVALLHMYDAEDSGDKERIMSSLQILRENLEDSRLRSSRKEICMENDAARRSLQIFMLACADRLAVYGQSAQAVAIGNEAWILEKKFAEGFPQDQNTFQFVLIQKLSAYYIAGGEFEEAVRILIEFQSMLRLRHRDYCAFAWYICKTARTVGLENRAERYDSEVTRRFAESDDPVLVRKKTSWQMMGTVISSMSGPDLRWDISPAEQMYKVWKMRQQWRFVDMNDLDWKSVELPFLKGDPNSMERAKTLFLFYGGHEFEWAKYMYNRRVKPHN